MRKIAIAITLLLIPLCAHAVQREYKVEFYDRWAGMNYVDLLNKGYNYLNDPTKYDSALVCYTIVANRYFEGQLKGKERRWAIIAMENAANLYISIFYDYQVAWDYLKQAERLSKETGYKHTLPYIYSSMGNIVGLKKLLIASGDLTLSDEGDLFRGSFRLAVEQHDTTMAISAFACLCELAFLAGTTSHIAGDIALYNSLHYKPTAEDKLYTDNYLKAVECFCRKDYEGALRYFRQSERSVDSNILAERSRLTASMGATIVLRTLQRGDEERTSILSNITRARRCDAKDYLIECYRQMSDYCARNGQKDSAYLWHVSYVLLKDSLMNYARLLSANDSRLLSQLQTVNEEVKIIDAKRQQQFIILKIIAAAVVTLTVLLAICFAAYRRQRRRNHELYKQTYEWAKPEEEKYKGSTLDETEKDGLYHNIKEVMEDTAAVCSDDFSLKTLADRVGASHTHVSQVINERFVKNFSQLHNYYRIREACRRLSDTEHYGHLTIEGVAATLGFKSRTTFAATFKRVTGLTPSQYQREALKNQAS